MNGTIGRIVCMIILSICISLSFQLPLSHAQEQRCPSCGEIIEEGSAFCTACGFKLSGTSEGKSVLKPEDILTSARRSIFCISALHNRYIYDSLGEKELVPHLLGTAFAIKKGFLLTDLSIVDGAKEIRLTDWEGKTVQCTLFGSDYLYGIAILKADTGDIPPLEWGDSNKVKAGDPVYAIGFPSTKGEAKVGAAIGKGIVSAFERSRMGIRQYENFIQTDVPFSEGMSGAPLLSKDGKVIGIIAMLMHSKGYFLKSAASIGFASPSNSLRKEAETIMEGKRKRRGWLGIIINDIGQHPDDNVRKAEKGIFAEFIIPSSPAEKSGIQSGDVIVSMNGESADKIHVFQDKIVNLAPGERIILKTRNGKGVNTHEIVLEDRPDKIRLSPRDMVCFLTGLKFQEGKKGKLEVSYVKRASAAYNLEIEPGHILEDILVKEDYKSEKEDLDFFDVSNWKDFDEVGSKAFSDYDFFLLLRFKVKDAHGFMKNILAYGIQQNLPSA